MNEEAIETYRQHALLPHLTDEELEGQLGSTLTRLAARRTAAHLKRCLFCKGRLKHYKIREFEKLVEEILSPLELEVLGSRVLEVATLAEIAAGKDITEQEAKDLCNKAGRKLYADRRVQAVLALDSR